MRRIGLMAAASVMGAVSLALSPAGSAAAAEGTLTVGLAIHTNPSGCYTTNVWPMFVTNNTNQVATVFGLPNCQGLAIGRVSPNQSNLFEFGTSVAIS
ncbi:hypothetical protein [Streptomyces rugosispiralis]|uniref:Secreted protein n=1 Tax=Streptomyces rugosispiralis TaxID=2967341 RepID=A0ABT1UZR3_9ACTN|nr:hypothetical protein [Streptomyces rugosispiralis]MCQ8190631.1 hypothetical protein [Streptomyces rugosispiralis]